MSYDFIVSTPHPVDVAAWCDALARLGIDAEMEGTTWTDHPGGGWPVVLTIRDADVDLALPGLQRLQRFGAIATGFELYPSSSGATLMATRDDVWAALLCAVALADAAAGVVRDPQTAQDVGPGPADAMLAELVEGGTFCDVPRKPVLRDEADDDEGAGGDGDDDGAEHADGDESADREDDVTKELGEDDDDWPTR